VESKEFQKELSNPFFGPIGWLMRNAAKKGAKDPLYGDKRSLGLFVCQAYSMWISLILAGFAFLTLALSIK
jgi:hypothetical protein